MTGIISDNVGRTSGLIKAASGGGSVWNLIKSQTASSSSDVSFVNGSSDVVLDSTYPIYVFKCINIHPSASDELSFNGSDDTSSHSYDVIKTTTHFYAIHAEDGTQGQLYYNTSEDTAQGTGFQNFLSYGDNATDNDSCFVGSLRLFNPSSTTFVKHFIARTNSHDPTDYSIDSYVAGYFNTTSAIDAMQFKFSSGNIDTGDICLYGIL